MARCFATGASRWRLSHGRAAAILFSLTLFASTAFVPSLRAADRTPRSPEVRAAILKGIDFLENGPGRRPDADAIEGGSQTGLKALVGLTLVKSAPDGAEAQLLAHPRIREAVAAIRAEIASDFSSVPRTNPVYTLAISLLFLLELDADAHRLEITALVDRLVGLQKSHGGWGYIGNSAGDLSMTQFAAVSLWLADEHQIPVETPVWERLCNFAIRVQDPSGKWGYQAKDPGNFTRIAQEEMRHSMTAAGLCTLTLAAERCGILEFKQPKPKDVPFEPTEKSPRRRPISPRVNVDLVLQSLRDGDQWLSDNYTVSPASWPYYYLYAFERFQSIREHTIGEMEDSPRWYNDGVELLLAAQGEDGCWVGQSPTSLHPTADTCFALLFLMRSFRNVLDRRTLGAGWFRSGRLANDGEKTAAGEFDSLIKAIGDERQELAEVIEAIKKYADANSGDAEPGDAEPGDANAQRTSAQKQLIRLFAGSESPLVREKILRVLAREDNLDHAPLFIEALRDQDVDVIRAADDALSRLSRKIAGVAPLNTATDAEVDAVIAGWKRWYRSIKPEADERDEPGK